MANATKKMMKMHSYWDRFREEKPDDYKGVISAVEKEKAIKQMKKEVQQQQDRESRIKARQRKEM